MNRVARPALALFSVAALALATACGVADDGADPPATPQVTPGANGTPPATPPPSPITLQNPTVTPSGLRYQDIVVGTGPSPEEGQRVTVHYTGYFIDGRKFDSSVDRGQPFTFVIGVGQVIRGWDEGVATMKVGGKRLLYIPANLAYGSRGLGPIPPDTDLIFEVELLEIR
jgi:peptidylprolyl isomerase